MLTVTKVPDFQWTQTSSIEERNESKITEAFANFHFLGIALQANRAESFPFLSIRVASLL
jgi:hypothetical protein